LKTLIAPIAVNTNPTTTPTIPESNDGKTKSDDVTDKVI